MTPDTSGGPFVSLIRSMMTRIALRISPNSFARWSGRIALNRRSTTPRYAESPHFIHCGAEALDERCLLFNRELLIAAGARGGIDRQCFSKIAQDLDVAYDQTIVLPGEDAVRASNCLHQRLIAHRLIDIDRRARRHVEAGGPHRADERNPKRILRVLEFALEVFLDHALAVGPNVQASCSHLAHFVLRL